MLVEMNNMDFGEFIQIYDICESKKVLTIDCGSLNKRKFSYIVSKKLNFDTEQKNQAKDPKTIIN